MSKRPDVGRQALAGTAGQLRDAWSLFGEEVGGRCIMRCPPRHARHQSQDRLLDLCSRATGVELPS